jgi:hypothetical protein
MTFPFPHFMGPRSVTTEFTASAVNSGAASTYTFSSQALGAPENSRVIGVFITGWRGANTTVVSSVTIAGVSATKQAAASASNSHDFELWTAVVPNVTAGNVVVNWSASVNRCGIGMFRIVGAGDPTPYDISTSNGTSASLSVNVDVPPNGGMIAGIGGIRNSSTFTSTWTGASEEYDQQIGGGVCHSGARIDIGSSQSGKSILVATSAVTDLGAGLIVASWRA